MKRLTALILFLYAGFSVWSLEICPEKMQAVLMVKIIPFVKEFEAPVRDSTIQIGVYGNHEIAAFLEEAAKKASFRIRVKIVPKYGPLPDDLQMIYFPLGTSANTVRKLNRIAKEKKILTVCGNPDMVMDQNITLSFHVFDEKPKILVNMDSASREGKTFSAKFLNLADVRNFQ